MFGSMVLDTAAGIVLVYVLLSLLCSGIHEFLAWALKWRPKLLKAGIQQLLADPKLRNLADEIFAHPLLSPFS